MSLSGSVTRWEPPISDNSTSMRSCGFIAVVEPDMVGEQTLQDAHRIAALEPWRLRTNPLGSRLADRLDNPVGDAFFNAALRRANNLKDAFLMARSLILRRELREGDKK